MKTITFSIFFSFCLTKVCFTQIQPFDYLGQNLSDNTEMVFDPGKISLTESIEKSIAISPIGDELFFMRGSGWPYSKIMHMVKHDSSWKMPDTAFFSKDSWATEPAFSADGKILYFSSSRGKSDMRFYNIWRIIKTSGVWSEPENAIDLVGDNILEFHPSVINDGSVYFCYWDYDMQIGDIYLSRNIGGNLSKPIKVGFPISTEYNDTDPYLDYDETFMIFKSNRPGGYGDNDLYISFKKEDNNWGIPLNMGPRLNSSKNDNPVDISPDGKYLFYYINTDIYWTQAKPIIDSLKQVDLRNKNVR